MILLDSSLSMEEPLSTGETKMAAAKRTIMEVLSKVPPTTRVGLRVYGQSASLLGCRSTATLVPLGTNNRMQIAASLLRVRPTGPTPISLSIRRSINEDFNGIPGNRHVILVSDGAETCDTDPCGVAVDMVRNNINVKIDVVGYGIHDLYAVRQLRCIALSTYGKFYKADTAAQLADSLGKAMQSETNVQGRILVPGGGGP
jgi:Ca-activated chloride channel family protein